MKATTDWKRWFRAAGIRAARTMAQTAAATATPLCCFTLCMKSSFPLTAR